MRLSTKGAFGVRVAVAAAGTIAGWRLIAARRVPSLAGKLVVVTGGSRGLGLLLARELASVGARVVALARDGEELERAAAQLRECGLEIEHRVCDVTDRGMVRDVVAEIEATHGPIEVLVNNAGLLHFGSAPSITHDDMRTAMETNFWGAVNTIDAVLPGMMAREDGRIVNICSVGGVSPIPFMLPYSASKAALNGYSLNLGYDLAPHGVSVTVVHPFVMRTGGAVNGTYRGEARRGLYAAFSFADESVVMAIDPARVARKVVRAAARRESVVMVGWPTRIAAVMQGVAPRTLAAIHRVIARALPQSLSREGESGEAMAERMSGAWRRLVERSRAKNNQPRGGLGAV
jgi:short-subunit dehydrogenase